MLVGGGSGGHGGHGSQRRMPEARLGFARVYHFHFILFT